MLPAEPPSPGNPFLAFPQQHFEATKPRDTLDLPMEFLRKDLGPLIREIRFEESE